MSLIDQAGNLVTGGVTSVISKVFSSIGGHKAERFSTPDKINMYASLQTNLLNPYLKEIFGFDTGDTNPDHIEAAKEAQYLINTGQIPSYNRSRPSNEVGSAMNDAAHDVATITWVANVFEQAWLFLTWDMWKSDSEDLIQGQRVNPLLKMVDAYVDILIKNGVPTLKSPYSIQTVAPVPVKTPVPVSTPSSAPLVSVPSPSAGPASGASASSATGSNSQTTIIVLIVVAIIAFFAFKD